MTQALYRKWRPKKWEEVIGQEHVVQTLQNAITGDRVGHAYLFSGPRGTGKTTVARLLAKAVNCQNEDLGVRPCNICTNCTAVNENRFLDLIEIDAASNTSVDDVRDLRDKINFIPSQGKYKIYIIDEVHMLSKSAFNALLKTLEEPPPHAIFILATTEIHNIPATVLSRCQRHEFRRLPLSDIVKQLQLIANGENIAISPEALTFIARQSTGSFRDAISLLDQLASAGQKITLDMTQTVLGTATNQSVLVLIESILDRQPATGLEGIQKAIDAGTDPRALARQIVGYLRALLLYQMGNDKQVEETDDIKKYLAIQAKAFSTTDVLRMVRIFNHAANDQSGGWQPSLSLELALTEVMETSFQAEPVKTPSVVELTKARAGVRAPVVERLAMPSSKPEMPPRRFDADPQLESADRENQKVPEIPQEQDNRLGNVIINVQPISNVVTLEQIAGAWRQVRAIIKPQNPALEALINSGKLLEVKDGMVVLGFVNDTLLSKINTPEQMTIIRKAITQVLGVDMPICCIVSNAKQGLPPDIKQNGMVATALQAGGEIVDNQE